MMPPKQDISAIQQSYATELKSIKNRFSKQLDEMKEAFESTINDLQQNYENLLSSFTRLEEKNKILENRIDHLEQKELKNNIILSGKLVTDFAAKSPANAENKSLWAVHQILSNKLKLQQKKDYIIENAFRLGTPQNGSTDIRPIMMIVDDNISKKNIFKAVTQAKIKGIYVNESLTERRKHILKNILKTRKASKKYLQVFTIDGNIMVRRNKEDKKTEKISTETDLQKILDYLISSEQTLNLRSTSASH
jgi:hypothetical protein